MTSKYTHIFHLADLHFRKGDIYSSRYEEYSTTFDRIVSFLSTHPNISTSLIVIAGDIFHNKSMTSSSSNKLFCKFMQDCSDLATVVIIRGNHDYQQEFPDEIDLISSFVDLLTNVHYLDKTGLYEFGNIGFGLVAIQDTLKRGETSGISHDLPPFPSISDFTSAVTTKIALFHGSIGGCSLQNGYIERKGYPITWFEGYDFIMLGDVHQQQVHRYLTKFPLHSDVSSAIQKDVYTITTYLSGSNAPYAYPGSTIQQDIGESIFGHGFIEWALDTKSVTLFHVRNNFGSIKIIYDRSYSPIVIVALTHENRIKIPLRDLLNYGWLPQKLRVEIYGVGFKSTELAHEIEKSIYASGRIITSLKHFSHSTPTPSSLLTTEIDPTSHTTTELSDLSSMNSIEKWLSVAFEKTHTHDLDEFIKNPDSLSILLNESTFPSSLLPNFKDMFNSIPTKNNTITTCLNKYKLERAEINSHSTIRINYLEWNWLYCFGENNYINFDTEEFSNGVVLLAGKNASGKTAILEIILLAIFDEVFPSRQITMSGKLGRDLSAKHKTICMNESSCISLNKPHGASSNVSIIITVNGISYKIHRSFTVYKTDLRKSNLCEITNLATNTKELGESAINRFIKHYIGSLESFLQTVIISQYNDSDFFALDCETQKKIIDDVLRIKSANEFITLCETSAKHHESICKTLSNELDKLERESITKATNGKPLMNNTELNEKKAELLTLSTQYNLSVEKSEKLKSTWSSVAEQALSSADIPKLSAELGVIRLRIGADHFNIDSKSTEITELQHNNIIYESNIQQISNDIDAVTLIITNLRPKITGFSEDELTNTHINDEITTLQQEIEETEKDLETQRTGFDLNRDELRSTLHSTEKQIRIQSDLADDLRIKWAMYDETILQTIERKPIKQLSEHESELLETIKCKQNEVLKFQTYLQIIGNHTIPDDLTHFEITDTIDVLITIYKNTIVSYLSEKGHCNSTERCDEIIARELTPTKCVKDLKELRTNLVGIQHRLHAEQKFIKISEKDVSESRAILSKWVEDLAEVVTLFNVDIEGEEDGGEKLVREWFDYFSHSLAEESTLKNEMNRCLEELDLYKDVQYNPKCSCCMKHPQRLQHVKITSRVSEIQSKLTEFKEEIEENIRTNFERIRTDVLSSERERKVQNARRIVSQFETKSLEIRQLEQEEQTITDRIRSLDIWMTHYSLSVIQHIQTVCHNSIVIVEKDIEFLRIKLNEINIAKCANYYDQWKGVRQILTECENKRSQSQRILSDIDVKLMQLNGKMTEIETKRAQLIRMQRVLLARNDWLILHDNESRLNQLSRQKDALFTQKDECRLKIDRITNEINDFKKYTELKTIHELVPVWKEWKKVSSYLTDMGNKICELKKLIDDTTAVTDMLNMYANDYKQCRLIINELTRKTTLVEQLKCIIQDYSSDIYLTKIEILVNDAVNKILSSAPLGRPIVFTAKWLPSDGRFVWSIKDGKLNPSLEKCSGAQRFFISFAFRLALTTLGAGCCLPEQIFMDEGFTACDAECVASIPSMLRHLVEDQCVGKLRSLFIVSHLEDLRSAATAVISINRDSKYDFTKVQIGDKIITPSSTVVVSSDYVIPSVIPSAGSTATAEIPQALPVKKKPGRPKKVIQMVTVTKEGGEE